MYGINPRPRGSRFPKLRNPEIRDRARNFTRVDRARSCVALPTDSLGSAVSCCAMASFQAWESYLVAGVFLTLIGPSNRATPETDNGVEVAPDVFFLFFLSLFSFLLLFLFFFYYAHARHDASAPAEGFTML